MGHPNTNMALTITPRKAEILEDGEAVIYLNITGSFAMKDGRSVILTNQKATITIPADEVDSIPHSTRSPFSSDPRMATRQ